MSFDKEHFVRLPSAIALVSDVRRRVSSLSARKFLVGIAKAGIIDAFAERYTETVQRIDEVDLPMLRFAPEIGSVIPIDFWRYSLAVEAESEQCFRAGNLGNDYSIGFDQLPYRFRKNFAVELPDKRMRLFQLAEGVYFPRADLEAYLRDPKWQSWIAEPEPSRKRGRIPEWKWDEVKAALTREAASDSDLLKQGTGAIVNFMAAEFRHLHDEQQPDLSELYAYAQLCGIAPIPPDDLSAPGSPD